MRNKITFDKHVVRSPTSVIFTVCSFLMYWSGLLKEADKEMLQKGVQVLMIEASRLASATAPAAGTGAG